MPEDRIAEHPQRLNYANIIAEASTSTKHKTAALDRTNFLTETDLFALVHSEQGRIYQY